jgi:hypothetical protein
MHPVPREWDASRSSAPCLRINVGDETAASHRLATLLTTYRSGAIHGKRLGTSGYSYDFVAGLFAPLFERLGPLVQMRNRAAMPRETRAARAANLCPVHVSFHPFQDAYLAPDIQNVVVPAWEFPDVPDHGFDGNPQNNWVATANRCSMVIVGGQFTADALDRAGVTAPVRIVPVPTPASYFETPPWQYGDRTVLECSTHVFPDATAGVLPLRADAACIQPRESLGRRFGDAARRTAIQAYRQLVKPCLPRWIAPAVTAALRAGFMTWRGQRLRAKCSDSLDLSGIVYTSIFNPQDGRKNWEDTITAFLCALQDCEDATLVLKLATSDPTAVQQVVSFYRRLDVPHRCRLAVIPAFLTETEMLDLVRASTYYITSTRAEGNCLPVMNCLAAGRPCISPSHTAISDYFTAEMGLVVDSHPEPAHWPQDCRQRWRTTCHRLVWTSLVEQIRRGYRMAKADRKAYEAMAAAGREKMRQWAHPESVWPRLRSAMQTLRCPAESVSAPIPSRHRIAA